MITTKQRSKSYRVAQHDTGMRDACKINVRGQRSAHSSVRGGGSLFDVPKMRGMSCKSPMRAGQMTENQMTGDRMTEDQMPAEQWERSVGR